MVTNSLYSHLTKQETHFNQSFVDSLHVHFTVDEKAHFCIDSLEISSDLQSKLPQIEAWIHDGVAQIPKALPAIKRGIPIKAQFQIPIVFKVD